MRRTCADFGLKRDLSSRLTVAGVLAVTRSINLAGRETETGNDAAQVRLFRHGLVGATLSVVCGYGPDGGITRGDAQRAYAVAIPFI